LVTSGHIFYKNASVKINKLDFFWSLVGELMTNLYKFKEIRPILDKFWSERGKLFREIGLFLVTGGQNVVANVVSES